MAKITLEKEIEYGFVKEKVVKTYILPDKIEINGVTYGFSEGDNVYINLDDLQDYKHIKAEDVIQHQKELYEANLRKRERSKYFHAPRRRLLPYDIMDKNENALK